MMNEYVREHLDGYDVFEVEDITDWRAPRNTIETNGVIYMAANWICENLVDCGDIKEAYDNIHGWRDNVKGGSFNIDDNFKFYDAEDRLEISDVILNGNCVYLEVWDTEENCAVAYIRVD